jgi:hypothetical protein
MEAEGLTLRGGALLPCWAGLGILTSHVVLLPLGDMALLTLYWASSDSTPQEARIPCPAGFSHSLHEEVLTQHWTALAVISAGM